MIGLVATLELLIDHFAEDSDLGKVCSNVVVQVGSDARADSFKLEQPRYTIAIGHKGGQCNCHHCKSQKPPTTPDRRRDSEGKRGWKVAHHSVRVDRSDQEAICSRRKVCKVHRALIGEKPPVVICPFELI